MPFNQPYEFKHSGKRIVLRHKHGGTLRTSPGNLNHVDGQGGEGVNAQWIVHLEGGARFCRLQNERSKKYLRIWRNGNHIDCEGGLGPMTKFKIHYHSRPNGIKLESDRFHGKYIAVKPGKHVHVGVGGPHCHFHAMRQGGGGGGGGGAVAAAMIGGAIIGAAAVAASKPKPHHPKPHHPKPQPQPQMPVQGVFGLPYQFKAHNTVVVRSNYGKHLRVHPQNLMRADGIGGTGHFAQWKVHLVGMGVIRLQNCKSGKYLRITAQHQVDVGGGLGALTKFRFHHYQHPHGVKLQSCQFPNKYIAIMPDGRVLAGAGGPHCKLTFWRQGQAQPNVVYKPAKVKPVVIVQNPAPAQIVVQSNAAQQAQMQQQMEQMKIAQDAQLAQQQMAHQQQLEMERAKMQSEMEAQQASIAAQQQAVLDAQNALLQQQQAMMQQNSNSPNAQVVVQQEIQQEGISGQAPINPQYVNAVNTNSPPAAVDPSSYPQLQQPVSAPPVAAANDAMIIPNEEAVPEEKEPAPVPTMGQENADNVKTWLTTLNMDRYYDSFIKNGYDTLDRVGEITPNDLKEMGVALGHIKTITRASALAPFQNKKVKIQSMHYESYLVEKTVKDHNNGKRCILKHSSKDDNAGCWLFEVLDMGTFRLKHLPTGSWLRLQKAESEADTRSPFVEKNSTLQLIREQKGVYFIKRADEECYLRFAEPSTFGYDKVMVEKIAMNVGRVRIICV